MKLRLILALFISVSFLAVCRAADDDFEEFDDAPPAKSAPVKKVAPNAVPAQATAKPAPTLAKNPLTKQADELYKKGAYDKVTTLLWANVEKNDREGLLLLARAHEKRGEADQMIKALNILTAKDAKDYDAFYLLGNAYFLKNKNKETLENYKTALEINPKFEPAYLGLAKYYEKKKNPYELRILYQDMIDNIGHRTVYLAKLCEINTADGVFQAAIANCKEALTQDSALPEVMVNLAMSYKGTGETALAEQTLKAAAKQFGRSEPAQYAYAKWLEDQKNYVDAFPFYKNAAGADEKSARAWLGVATCAFELQKFDIAFVGYKKACQYDKKNAVYFRKATTQIKNIRTQHEWVPKYEAASEQCSL